MTGWENRGLRALSCGCSTVRSPTAPRSRCCACCAARRRSVQLPGSHHPAFVLSPYFLRCLVHAAHRQPGHPSSRCSRSSAFTRSHRSRSMSAFALACLCIGAAALKRQSFLWLGPWPRFFLLRRSDFSPEAMAGAGLWCWRWFPWPARARVERPGPPSAIPLRAAFAPTDPVSGRHSTLRTVGLHRGAFGIYAALVLGPSGAALAARCCASGGAAGAPAAGSGPVARWPLLLTGDDAAESTWQACSFWPPPLLSWFSPLLVSPLGIRAHPARPAGDAGLALEGRPHSHAAGLVAVFFCSWCPPERWPGSC